MTPSPPFLPTLGRCLPPALAVVLLGACASAPSPTPASSAVPVPARWHQPTATSPLDTAALARWWTRFNDPVLDQLVSDALANSPDIRTALSKIAESRAVRGTVKSALFPTITAGVSGGGTRTENRNTGTASTTESYNAALDASWQIDLFGKQRQALSAADADLAQTAENFHAAQVSLAAEIASTYVTLRSAESSLDVVQNSLSTREQTLQLTQWREQTGMGNALDTLQSDTSLEQARASIPALRQTAAQARNQLALLSGLTPGSLDTLLAARTALPALPATLATGIPAETLRQRPDVRAAEYAVQAAAALSAAARRERLPSLNLSGSIGIDALKAGHLFSPDSVVSGLLGSLTAPVFDAGSIRQTITIRTEQEKQAVYAYRSAVLTALSDVENALIAVRLTSENLAALQKATASAQKAQDLASLQYQAGAIDLLTLLDTQRTLLGLKQQVVSTQADELTAHIQLYKALGGGWSPASNTSAPSAPAPRSS